MYGQWIEIDQARLAANLKALQSRAAMHVRMAPVVKSNAYGHGLELAARAFCDGGADWFCVHSLGEALELRDLSLGRPILVLGPVEPRHFPEALEAGVHLTVSELSALQELAAAAGRLSRVAPVHLKLETGTRRQGLLPAEVSDALEVVTQSTPLELAGVSSHFANVEDTTRHRFAQAQRESFEKALEGIPAPRPIAHIASSAAAILFPETHFDLIRPGISAYGYWPSRETLASATERGLADLDLSPALRWVGVVSQVKPIEAGEFVGYGRTFKYETPGRVAVIPVGYADGYPRGAGGQAWVLLHGRRCQVVGRICMNLMMVDVSHVPEVEVGSEATLLGRDGEETIEVETLADWAGTIHYEVVARLAAHIPRRPA